MSNLNELKPIISLNPFARFCCTIGNLPSSYMASLTYEEQLLWFCDYLQNTVIPAVNNNAEVVKELQELYIKLKNYVDNYFKNLDVQNEINNKLDEMVETGELQNILTNYVDFQKVYNTFTDLLNDINLIDNMKVKTLGYYSINDGGGANYLITSTQDDTQIQKITSSDGLFAELIIDSGILNMKKVGANSQDSSFDNSPILKSIIEIAINNKKFNTIYFPSGYYYFATSINLVDDNINLNSINIIGDGQNYLGTTGGTVLAYRGSIDSYFIEFNNITRCYFKNINIVGNNSNNCFSINVLSASNFYNVNFSNFLNSIWLKIRTAYAYFNQCYFNNALNGAKGVIINQHYTDGRSYTGDINTEYIYFTDCSFEGGFKSCNHVVIYGGEYIHFTKCDLCNSNDIALVLNSSDWAGILLDIMTRDMSFVNNKINISITTGTGACGRITIDGHFVRNANTSKDNRILVANGNSNARISYLKLTGTTDTFVSADFGIVANYTYLLDLDLLGEFGNVSSNNSIVRKSTYYEIGKIPYFSVLTPSVSVEDNKVIYDFSDVLNDYDCLIISASGLIGGAQNSCYFSGNIFYGSTFGGQKTVTYNGANISNVSFIGKKLTITCAYTPSTDISKMRFTARK